MPKSPETQEVRQRKLRDILTSRVHILEHYDFEDKKQSVRETICCENLIVLVVPAVLDMQITEDHWQRIYNVLKYVSGFAGTNKGVIDDVALLQVAAYLNTLAFVGVNAPEPQDVPNIIEETRRDLRADDNSQ